MNNLEKLKLLEETVKLRRQVMKLDESSASPEPMHESSICSSGASSRTGMDEEAGKNCKHGIPSDSCKFCRGAAMDESLDTYYRIAGLLK